MNSYNRDYLIDVYDELQNTRYCIIERIHGRLATNRTKMELINSLDKTERLINELHGCSDDKDYDVFFKSYNSYWREELNV